MKVLKFGGSSIGSAESILSVKRIVEAQTEPTIVVVSALGGITDQLIRTSQMAVEGNSDYQKSYDEIAQRHYSLIDAVIPSGDELESLREEINAMLNELHSIYQGVFLIRDLSPKTLATVVSYGERMSSRIVTKLISGSQWRDSREFIKTERQGSKNILSSEVTYALVRKTWEKIPPISVVGGFISTDKDLHKIHRYQQQLYHNQ